MQIYSLNLHKLIKSEKTNTWDSSRQNNTARSSGAEASSGYPKECAPTMKFLEIKKWFRVKFKNRTNHFGCASVLGAWLWKKMFAGISWSDLGPTCKSVKSADSLVTRPFETKGTKVADRLQDKTFPRPIDSKRPARSAIGQILTSPATVLGYTRERESPPLWRGLCLSSLLSFHWQMTLQRLVLFFGSSRPALSVTSTSAVTICSIFRHFEKVKFFTSNRCKMERIELFFQPIMRFIGAFLVIFTCR